MDKFIGTLEEKQQPLEETIGEQNFDIMLRKFRFWTSLVFLKQTIWH